MRIIFQRVKESHLDSVRKWRTSEEVTKYLYTDPAITKEDQKKWHQLIMQDMTRMDWVINADEKDVGVVYVYDINLLNRRCFWSYYLGERSTRGKGIGRAIELNILRYVFEQLDLHKLCCEVFEWNDKVVKIHQKYGSRIEGVYRDHIWKGGGYHNIVCMGILRQDWEQSVKDKFQYQHAEIEEWERKKEDVLAHLSN